MTSGLRVCLALGVGFVVFGIAPFSQAQTRTVTFVGQTVDQTDFQALGFGQAGYYFPQFGATSPVTERPTDENMAFAAPSWTGFQFDIGQSDRTFSPDAGLFSTNPLVLGVYSKGGQPTWDSFTLPDGTTGLSGAAVDEAATNNSNNSVNRIQLGAGVPSSFLLRIVMDNTNEEHDSAGRLNPRGANAADNLSPNPGVNLTNLTFNGTTDVYTFRYDNFIAGDFIKIRFNSGVPGEAPSFGGLMFDVVSNANADFDSDTEVDGRDFLTWQAGFNSGTTLAEGDANGSNSVDASDLDIWESQFGLVGGGNLAAVSTTVPEPSTLVLVLLVFGALGLFRISTRHVPRAGS